MEALGGSNVTFVNMSIPGTCKCFGCVRDDEEDGWEDTDEGKTFKANYIMFRDAEGGLPTEAGKMAYKIMMEKQNKNIK